ncbi:Formate hydrogenlyase subunit 3/Multisubunit Na+/H+ antiporter MnhD subunit [Paramagnetospirillum magnetotacticum MS-1]|uniref:Formate hydrogenlyase subunit 3/Multisubunit Na+/H+ antiporter MnhD subunit n=1 Tax=Paramagnetospirillum magnetotacticum MS-1 TaxID=272627 RepID=A0A0C2UZ18_PARME|nr:hydrogenase 4 subunit F [Paramagnetospirillum magnetotacticum]KIL98076.1 Formate hydrogenlyase subunit 3/Multisubunit Na+/H+ antiporter MnhD subunit [Paramagnetospirillum magnetotacticum MS-1]
MFGIVSMLPGFDNPLLWILGVPLGSAGFLAVLKDWRVAAWVNVLASVITFGSSLMLIHVRPEPTRLLFIDDFNVYLVVLTAFVGLSTSIFSAAYIARESEAQRLSDLHLRFYHSMYQAFLFTMLLALCANNTGVMWVAVEAATLTTVLMVSLYRTREAIEAAWKYFILCSVGIGLALFGTTLVYLAAQPVMGDGADAMAWTLMIKQAHRFQPDLLNLAFVFVLVGYGTKVGLAPLHAWLPDAHAEGPTPISAVLSGLLLNVALYALLRFKMVIAANGATLTPGPLLIVMGLSSLFLSAFMLYRRGDIKRLFAYSSIEHMGVITFAFGMGGAVANFAGLLHMTMHSLTKSAIFFAVGIISQNLGTKRIASIKGLTQSHPVLGWGFVLAVLAIAGLPPMGVFMSEFLVLSSTFARAPLLAIPLAIGLLLAFGALVARLQGMAFGEPPPHAHAHGHAGPLSMALALTPLWVHMLLVLVAGLYLPKELVAWFQSVARILG